MYVHISECKLCRSTYWLLIIHVCRPTSGTCTFTISIWIVQYMQSFRSKHNCPFWWNEGKSILLDRWKSPRPTQTISCFSWKVNFREDKLAHASVTDTWRYFNCIQSCSIKPLPKPFRLCGGGITEVFTMRDTCHIFRLQTIYQDVKIHVSPIGHVRKEKFKLHACSAHI